MRLKKIYIYITVYFTSLGIKKHFHDFISKFPGLIPSVFIGQPFSYTLAKIIFTTFNFNPEPAFRMVNK